MHTTPLGVLVSVSTLKPEVGNPLVMRSGPLVKVDVFATRAVFAEVRVSDRGHWGNGVVAQKESKSRGIYY